MHKLKWSESKKKLSRRLFEAALEAELADPLHGLPDEKLSYIQRIVSL